MIKYEATKELQRKVALDYALLKLRYPALFAFSLGVLIAWLIMPNADLGKILLLGIPIGLVYAATLFLSYRNKMIQRTAEFYEKLGTNTVTYKISDKGIQSEAGDASSFIPHRMIKKAWNSKKFLYFQTVSGRAVAIPLEAIDKKDSEKLEKLFSDL